MSDDWLRTSVGTSDADSITVMGRNVADELMGQVTLTQLTFLLVQRRMPSDGETRMLDAVLVSLADHGLTPIALSARLTYTGAPESLQGAIASGLLGGGSVFLGVVEDTARFLEDLLASPPDDLRAALAEHRGRVPGLGHPIHKVEDPRTPRLYAIAEESGTLGPHLRLLREVAEAHGKGLPINGAGVAGAALADMGFRSELLRGFALLARVAGLLGHLAEEMDHPLGMPLYREIDERAIYESPPEE
jgi:citrate synthase